jgi:NDP-sugar pyrophosphorylase family protein/aminoglycoside/choline kinase family phosphotransferase
MKRPTRAIILAAGLGTRIRPLSNDLPKALMPLWGRPMLERVFDLLLSWGTREVAINCHHQAPEIFSFVRERLAPRARVALSYEPQILGTGGALRKLEWFIAGEPFWLLNADVAADLEPTRLLRAFAAHRCLAALWMHPGTGPRTVDVRGRFVASFRSATPGAESTATFCGLHLLSPEILKHLPPRGVASIINAYEAAMRRGRRIAAVTVPGAFWADMGSPGQYLAAHRDVWNNYRARRPGRRLIDPEPIRRMRAARRRGVVIEGFAAIGDGVELARGARVRDSVIWDGAKLAASARASGAVIGRRAAVSGRVSGPALDARHVLHPAEQDAWRNLAGETGPATAYLLGARGSARSYARVVGSRRRALLVRYDPARRENTLFTTHARFLRTLGLPVPRILHDDPRRCFYFMEDLGDDSLQARVPRLSPTQRLAAYQAALREAARLHRDGARAARAANLPLTPAFSPRLYRWEHDLFIEEFLRRYAPLSAPRMAALRRELAELARRLRAAPTALIHRDLQSSNLLLCRGRVYLIDFQGMRRGPPMYDVASLLCDPYVSLDEPARQDLLEYYLERNPRAGSRRLFWLAAVQRLLQALGAFARLGAQPGTASFREHIPAGLAMLRRALRHVEFMKTLSGAVDSTLQRIETESVAA